MPCSFATGGTLGALSARWATGVACNQPANGLAMGGNKSAVCHTVPAASHAPFSHAGCEPMFATRKLQQFPSGELCHVFISHAGEQKRGFVDFLVAAFPPPLKVFLDEYTLEAGNDAMPAIDASLKDALVGEPPPWSMRMRFPAAVHSVITARLP
jgi:hypothetical protein